MTGRRGRVVRDRVGRTHYELRAKPDSADMDSLNGAPFVLFAGLDCGRVGLLERDKG